MSSFESNKRASESDFNWQQQIIDAEKITDLY